jgi:hypothetical protein
MLAQTVAVHGGADYLAGDPPLTLHRNVLYVPRGYAGAGLYDSEGVLLPHAGVWRGVPNLHLFEGMPRIEFPREGVPRAPSGQFCAYLGPINTHYGHFLVSNFCRLWNWPTAGKTRPRLLHLGPAGAGAWAFEVPAIAEALECLGFCQEDLLHFNQPIWLDEVLVAAPSFIENHRVYEAFARLGRFVGAKLLASVPRNAGPPVFLSKQKLIHGVCRLANEAAFCAVLAEAGIEIVCPEELGLAQQVALFRDRPLVASWIGSALHNSIFAGPSQLVVLNYEPLIWSNQKLIDAACGNAALYVHPTEGMERLGEGGGFHNNFVLRDPHLLARRIVGLISDTLRSHDPVSRFSA